MKKYELVPTPGHQQLQLQKDKAAAAAAAAAAVSDSDRLSSGGGGVSQPDATPNQISPRRDDQVKRRYNELTRKYLCMCRK